MEEFTVGGVPVRVVQLQIEPNPLFMQNIKLWEVTVGTEKKQVTRAGWDVLDTVNRALNAYYELNKI